MKKFIIWLLFLVYPSNLLSQSEDEKAKRAAKFLEAGIALQKVNKHEDALKNFEDALSIMDHPKIKYFKAVSLFELKRFKEARKVFEEINRDNKVEKYQNEIENKLQIISETLKLVPLIIRTADGQSAKVSINGKFAGFSPYETEFEPGEYIILIEREGFKSITKKVKLIGPGPQIEEFVLNVDDVKSAKVEPISAKTQQEIVEKIEKQSSRFAWVAFGSGIALFAAGSGFIIKHFVDRSNLREETAEHEADTMSSINAITGGILMGVGVGAVITSLFLFPDEQGKEEKVSFKLLPQSSGICYNGLKFSLKWK